MSSSAHILAPSMRWVFRIGITLHSIIHRVELFIWEHLYFRCKGRTQKITIYNILFILCLQHCLVEVFLRPDINNYYQFVGKALHW